ncbi:MAG: anaerobic ribonucleoside-triphosphate reductase [Nanoarchaeota archaeon]
MENNEKCNKETEVYSRIVGYFRPIKNWNDGKKEEFAHRVTFNEQKATKGEMKDRSATACAT